MKKKEIFGIRIIESDSLKEDEALLVSPLTQEEILRDETYKDHPEKIVRIKSLSGKKTKGGKTK